MMILVATDKDILNDDDGEFFQTEGHKKAAKYWSQGRCGKKAALCPWLLYNLHTPGDDRQDKKSFSFWEQNIGLSWNSEA